MDLSMWFQDCYLLMKEFFLGLTMSDDYQLNMNYLLSCLKHNLLNKPVERDRPDRPNRPEGRDKTTAFMR